jgi:hypothetical protein
MVSYFDEAKDGMKRARGTTKSRTLRTWFVRTLGLRKRLARRLEKDNKSLSYLVEAD